MASNMKEIKTRIKSVSSTMQITKAMELVASSKLRHAKERAQKSAPYFSTLYQTMTDIAMSNKDFTSIYTKKREIKNSLYIVIAGDRGLAGGYNSNILKETNRDIGDKSVKIVTIGKKSTDFYKKNGFDIVSMHDSIAENVSLIEVNDIVAEVTKLYKENVIDEVCISYTEFTSPLVQTPQVLKVLPMSKYDGKTVATLTEYDPSPEEVFDSIIPKYISGLLYGAIVESFASEQAARRVAMESASDNANDMITDLSLLYNRARQGAITQEISEIVAGANS